MIALVISFAICLTATGFGVWTTWKLWRVKWQFRFLNLREPSDELPTVSVCIPARNETHAMTRCLEAVLASDYEKLEVIVLDDSSVDDTSVLIKSFAHAGVRFVSGQPLPTGWLGKNHAFQGLLSEASGSVLLFLDVDTHIAPNTIQHSVEQMQAEDAALLSVVPKRHDNLRLSSVFGNLRYLWVLLGHASHRPAVSAAYWMVHTSALQKLGGFEPWKAMIQPERAVAERLTANNVHVAGRLASEQLLVAYEKRWSSLRENSVRLLQPMFGGSFGAIAVLLCVIVTLLPIALLVVAVFTKWLTIVFIALVPLLVVSVAACSFYSMTWRRLAWLGTLLWPYVVAQEVYFFILSIIKYGRGTVTWKGRRITVSK